MTDENRIILSSKCFKNFTEKEMKEIYPFLQHFVSVLFLEKKDFVLSKNEEGILLDTFLETDGSMDSFEKAIQKQTRKIEKLNVWLQEYEKDRSFFTLMKYIYTLKGKEEIAKNLLHQNIDREWITMVTGFSDEELEDL